MSAQDGDLRVRRTRKLLREALIELVEERGFERLTVGEITERAMVSRAAFYRNYRDKYQLVELIFDEAMADLTGTMSEVERPVRERWIAFWEHISAYHRLYGALLASPWFAERMRAALADMASRHFTDPAVRDGLAPTLVAAVFVQSITWWLKNGRPSPPERIAAQSAGIAAAIYAEAGTWS
ncbi:TetR/AcrR family transcriptional regulator [Nonomuraea insulae]|uniref:TetR/AcrR family transcriptional regulator n=1 Tax=Nonomuraea insulae TaxID=1616787 RepID=A0ABW1CMJ1_9ACTN